MLFPMNRTLRVVLPALAALLTGAAAVAAQTVPSPYQYIERGRSLSFYGGVLNPSGSVELSDSTSVDIGPKSAPLFGMRIGLGIGGPLSIEGNLAFSPSKRDLYDADPNADSTAIALERVGEVNELLMLAEGGFRFRLTGDRTYRGFAPFVLASAGAVIPLSGTSALEDSIPAHRRLDFGPSLAVGTGTGVDFFPSQRVSLRAEATFRLWRLETPPGMLPSGSGKRSGWKGNTGLTLGGAYHF